MLASIAASSPEYTLRCWGEGFVCVGWATRALVYHFFWYPRAYPPTPPYNKLPVFRPLWYPSMQESKLSYIEDISLGGATVLVGVDGNKCKNSYISIKWKRILLNFTLVNFHRMWGPLTLTFLKWGSCLQPRWVAERNPWRLTKSCLKTITYLIIEFRCKARSETYYNAVQ